MAKLFFSYSHKDENLRDRLETHLAALKREGTIETWHDRRILAGDELADVIDDNINDADVVLLLVSPDFIASDYCYQIEMQRAMERHAAGEARVIPVVLKPCDWRSTPFGKLLVAPKDGRPVVSWPDQDEAFLDVVNKIRQSIPKTGGSTAAVSKPTERVSAVPAPPRSSNLRLKKTFSEMDRDRFLDDAFDYMARFFEGSLQELKERNPGIDVTFRRLDAIRFTAIAYRDGKALSRCKIMLGAGFGRGITYSNNDQADDGSMNESLSVETDDQAQYLKALGMPMRPPAGGAKLSFEGAAEYYWSLFIDRLQ
jgi:TIR domain